MSAVRSKKEDLHDFSLQHNPKCHQCDGCTVKPISICEPLNPIEQKELSQKLSHITLSEGETLFNEADTGEHVYTVTSGYIKIFKTMPDGRCQIMSFVIPGDFFGLAQSGIHTYTAQAVTQSTLCRFSKASLEKSLDKWAHMKNNFYNILTHELCNAQNQILLLGRKCALEKVSSFILDIHKRSQKIGVHSPIVYLPMSRTDIADYLGLTGETVSRTFSALAKDGIIKSRGKRHVEIKEMAKLIAACGDEV